MAMPTAARFGCATARHARQQWHLGGQHGERVAPAGHQRHGGQEGQSPHGRGQPGDLVQQERVGQQRRERGQREDRVDVRKPGQPPRPVLPA